MTSPNGTIRSTAGTPDAPASHLALELTLHMDSDWHCGTGLGIPGGIDKLVNTDHDGLPFVPGKTLTGVWRDACELAAAALDGSTRSTGPAGGWHAWVEFLFGSQPVLSAAGSPTGDKPRPAALSVRPARYPAALAAALRSDEQRRLRDATTFVRPGAKIDPSTGRAADKFLRFEQMARCGVQLTASATLAGWSAHHPGGEDSGGEDSGGEDSGGEDLGSDGLDDEGRRASAALLLLGARLVESIGGKRRRGAGRCRLEVTQVEPTAQAARAGHAARARAAAPTLPTLDSVAEWLRARDGVAPPVPRPFERTTISRSPDRPDSPGWEVITLRMHLETPLIVQERTIGNAVRSLDFIPGSILLPAVLRRLAEADGWDPDSLARAGHLVVTNATVDVDGERGRPLPRTWFHTKEDETAAVNRLVEAPREPGAAAKPYKNTYVGASPPPPGSVPDDTNPFATTIRERHLTIHTHNVIDDKRQRPTSDVVGLYTYEAIAAGSVLWAEVRVRAGLLPEGADTALAGTWALGRSAKDDYGQVTVTVEGPPTPWAAAKAESSGADTEQTITVWLLSDVLLRDKRLRPSTDPREFADQLGARLGVALALTGANAAQSTDRLQGQRLRDHVLSTQPEAHIPGPLTDRVTVTRRVESWQRCWCLPRPTLLGLAAGSVLTFTASGRPSSENLDRVLAAGIGERTAEGFGQISIDDPLLRTRPGTLRKYSPSGDRRQAPFVPPRERVAYATAQVIEREAWRAHIQRASAAVAATAEGRKKALGLAHIGMDARKDQVKPTQLGGLRDVLTRLGEDDEIGYWLDRLSDRWPQAVYQQVKRLLTSRAEVWSLLDLGPLGDAGVARELTVTDGGADRLRADTELWAEAVRTLVTSCLTAHRRAAAGDGPPAAEHDRMHEGVRT